MAFARDSYTATAGQTDFTITFAYLNAAHVVVTKNGVTLTVTTEYTIVSGTTVRLVTGATLNDVIVITRVTSQTTRLVDYTVPSIMAEADLDTDSLQAFYIAQESFDRASLSMGQDSTNNWDATSKRIKNIATGTASTDAITKAQFDAAVIAAGNVPTPANPADDNKALIASAGSWSWTTFTVSLISDAVAFMKTFLKSADAATARTNLGLAIGTDVLPELAVVSQVDAEAGTSTAEKIWTAQRVKQAIAALGASGLPAPDFTSSEQTVTMNSNLDVAHSLGAIPTLVQVVLRCKTADLGYAVGDEVHVASYTPSSIDTGVNVRANATNVSLVTGNSLELLGVTTFNEAAITTTRWKFVVRAWS